MQHEGLARERAKTQLESSVPVCVGMHFLLQLIAVQATKHPWPRACGESGVFLFVFFLALGVGGDGEPGGCSCLRLGP
jgi:hypothetical protein